MIQTSLNFNDVKLKADVETVNIVNYNDFDDFINKSLFNGRNVYEIVPMEECNNYSMKRFNVTGNIKKYDIVEVDEYINGKTSCVCTHSLLDYMCILGMLDKGIYLIDISW